MNNENHPYYRPISKEVEVFEHAFKKQIPVLLKGPTGAGKSRFVEYMASKLNLELITVACHEETSAVDLIGRYIIKGADTVWQDGPMTTAIRKGMILYLDEFVEARPDTLVAVHSVTDHRRELYIDRLNEKVKAVETFLLVASFNPGYQRGWKELKPSTRQRFISLHFDYPVSEVETEIVASETGLKEDESSKLVKLAGKIRNLQELGLTESPSTRLLVDAGKLILDGLPPRLACEVAIIQPLTDDLDTIKALKDLTALYF